MKFVRVGFAVLALSVIGPLGCGGSSVAATSSAERAGSAVVPKPIIGGDYFPDLPSHKAGIIHQYFPVPQGPPLFGDGPLAEPNEIGDFMGLVAQVFQNGTATDSNGQAYFLDVDTRVDAGTYVGADGRLGFGAFCTI